MNKAMITAAMMLAVGLAGCGKKDAPPVDDKAAVDTMATPATPAAIPIDPAKPNACDRLADVNLTAVIDKATSTLKISGTANAPQLGYAAALQAGPLDKMSPPNQVVLLRANAPAAGGAAVTSVPLALDIPSAQPAYNSVRVVCPGVKDIELKVG